MKMPLRCRCGAVRGEIETARAYTRATCYCKDCRAFANYLAVPGLTDEAGGVDVGPIAPSAVRFTAGTEHIACMSLSPKGLLRWYADYCRTPLANTPRDPKLPYVGLVTACFDATPEEVYAAFGRRGRIVLNTKSSTGAVRGTPVALLVGGLRILAGMVGVRVRRDRRLPFFDERGRALREPDVLSKDKRAELTHSW